MELNSTQADKTTTIQLRKSTVQRIKDCKKADEKTKIFDTYDEVINKLVTFHHVQTGNTIVE
jgi:hypothetical protein